MVQPDVACGIAADKDFGFAAESLCDVKAHGNCRISAFTQPRRDIDSGFLTRITG
jgi:hypothetical protein